jgi:hypothetical protein
MHDLAAHRMRASIANLLQRVTDADTLGIGPRQAVFGQFSISANIMFLRS